MWEELEAVTVRLKSKWSEWGRSFSKSMKCGPCALLVNVDLDVGLGNVEIDGENTQRGIFFPL